MSNKRRKIKKKIQSRYIPKYEISDQQNARLQQAINAHLAGNTGFAESEYRALIAEKIGTPQLFCQLALICAQTGRRDEANRFWKMALSIDHKSVDARMNLAESYQLAGKIEKSIDYYQRLISEHSDFVVARYLLANLLKSQGKFDQASDHYKQIMTLQPEYTQAHSTYSGIHTYKNRSDPHIGQMIDLFKKPNIKPENNIHLAFALAKAFEDIKDYSQAFGYLKTGNDLRYMGFNYTIDSDRELIQSIIKAFSKDAMSQVKISSQQSSRPIFIVGMPRSGTSLVEKIISSHSDVYAAGELDYMFGLGTRLFLKDSVNHQFGSLDGYPNKAFEALGKIYLEKIRQLDSQARRITDKMPFNFMLIGLIKIALPNAIIIHCARDAKDNCLSIYKQNFTTGNYRFAYKLETVAQFHNQYRELMHHWNQLIPGEIYDVCYETLTEDPEAEIRKLISACDLEWQDACLDYDKNAGIIKTASAFQARQPIYTSSVKLWEKYQPFIQPLLDELTTTELPM